MTCLASPWRTALAIASRAIRTTSVRSCGARLGLVVAHWTRTLIRTSNRARASAATSRSAAAVVGALDASQIDDLAPGSRQRTTSGDRQRMLGAELARQPPGMRRDAREVLREAIVQVVGDPRPLGRQRIRCQLAQRLGDTGAR